MIKRQILSRYLMINRFRGKTPLPAGELVFGVNNPAVLLRKILGLFSMAKRQNSSMQSWVFFCSVPNHHFLRNLTDNIINISSLIRWVGRFDLNHSYMV